MKFPLLFVWSLALCGVFGSAANAQNPVLQNNSAPQALLTPRIEPYATLDAPQVAQRNGVWQVVNRAPGSFATRWILSETDATQIARLRFEWKSSGDAKINFFFKVNGRFYAVLLSGTEAVRAGTTVLGRAAQKRLPDGWNRVEIPLRAWLSARNPRPTSLRIEEILLGNWENAAYLLAGMGGNSVGTQFSVRRIEAVPTRSEKTAQISAPEFENGEIVWRIEDFDGLNAGAIRVRAATQTFDLTSPFLVLETELHGETLAQKLRFDAGRAGISLRDGETLVLVLESAERGALPNDVTLRAASWRSPVSLPRVQIDGRLPDWSGDFEDSSAGFVGRSSVVERLGAPERAGTALKLTNPRTAGRFETQIATRLDAENFPAFSFLYRCDERVRLDFQFRWSGLDYSIQFLDRDPLPKDSRIMRIGSIADAQGDGAWRAASFDLLGALKKTRPDATDFTIENFVLSDDNWMGNARGVHIWIDDFHFAPKAPREFEAKILGRDLSGVSGVAFAFDQSPQTRLDAAGQDGQTVQISSIDQREGLWFLHVRARNGANLWSETSSFPLWLEQTK